MGFACFSLNRRSACSKRGHTGPERRAAVAAAPHARGPGVGWLPPVLTRLHFPLDTWQTSDIKSISKLHNIRASAPLPLLPQLFFTCIKSEHLLYLTCPQTHFTPAILSSSHVRICFNNTNEQFAHKLRFMSPSSGMLASCGSFFKTLQHPPLTVPSPRRRRMDFNCKSKNFFKHYFP